MTERNVAQNETAGHSILPACFFSILMIFFLAAAVRMPDVGQLNGVALHDYPAVGWKELMDGSAQNAIGEWFGDRCFGHTLAVRLHNQIEYGVFHDGVGDWIQGRDRYLFSRSQAYSYAAGLTSGDDAFYDAYAEKVAKLQGMLGELDKDFIYIIDPYKAEIFPDKLPWNERAILKSSGENAGLAKAKLLAAFDKYGVHYCDMTDDLRAMQERGDFEVFCSTGHHWTLTAAATSVHDMLEQMETSPDFGSGYPQLYIDGLSDVPYAVDRDIEDLFNLLRRASIDSKTPEIHYDASEKKAFLFGTSYGYEIMDALWRSPEKCAFDSFDLQQYFTTQTLRDRTGEHVEVFRQGDQLEELRLLERIGNADLIMMEQQGLMPETHYRFVDYLLSALGTALQEDRLGENLAVSGNTPGVKWESFSEPEEWGRWSTGRACGITLSGDAIGAASGDLTLQLSVRSYAQPQEVTVRMNGVEVGRFATDDDLHDFSFPIPQTALRSGANELTFELGSDPVSPLQMGESEDSRELGLGFVKITLSGGAS